MTVLRLHFQVTGHTFPILSVAADGNLLASADQGNICLWSFEPSHAESGGPVLLRTIACPRQPIRNLFITPSGLHVVIVLAEDVIMFDIHDDHDQPHVLLHLPEATEDKILAAAWSRDFSSLAISTLIGVKIYKLLPAGSGTFGASSNETPTVTSPVQRNPVALKLIYDIVVKIPLSSTFPGSKRVVHGRVGSLAIDDSSEDIRAGTAVLVGIADGQHLCLWDIVTGSTLLTVSAVAPAGCKVERVTWHGPTAMSALLYSVEGELRRVDVHQIDITRQTTTPLFSFISDVIIAGLNFSAAPNIEAYLRPSAKPSPSACHAINQAYVHVIDRQRTLRTWLLDPNGAAAVAAYNLLFTASRAPIIYDCCKDDPNQYGSAPEKHGADERYPDGFLDPEAEIAETRDARISDVPMKRGDVDSAIAVENEPKTLDPQSVADETLVAYVIPSQLQGIARPGVLVVAGLTLSGLSFLPEGDIMPPTQSESPISEISGVGTRLGDGNQENGVRPRVLGMWGLSTGAGGQLALAVLWASRPYFQVLDAGYGGHSTVVQEIPIDRRHREDELTSIPRSDRPCYLTSWAHSTTLGIFLCGWNDGVVDVVNPRTCGRYTRLLPPDSTCIPATALALIPSASLFPNTSKRALLDPAFVFHNLCCEREISGGIVALVGGADGTLVLWRTNRPSRPWYTILAHTDAVVAVRSAMDAPQDGRARQAMTTTTWSKICRTGGIYDSLGDENWPLQEEKHVFFVVTAGANCEVKVWGVNDAKKQNLLPLLLRGYTVVGSTGKFDRLTSLELLSEVSMACGFLSGAVEVWVIPFAAREGHLATAREALQVFLNAHNGEVTSIVVSDDLRGRVQNGEGKITGRVVLTTSADCTVLRWASTSPGDNMTLMARYCFSSEPSAAVLLPIPSVHSARLAVTLLARRDCRFDREAKATSTELFRVMAAVDGSISVLEVASTDTLIGNQGTQRCLRGAVTNVFPGTPLIPRLHLLPPRERSNAEDVPSALRWAIGGSNGREAGWYDVLGGVREQPIEWGPSAAKRLAVAATLRGLWDGSMCQPRDQGMQDERNISRHSLFAHAEVQSEPQTAGIKKRCGTFNSEGTRGLSVWQRTAVKPSVKTLAIHPQKDNDASHNDIVVGDLPLAVGSRRALVKVIGGKSIRVNPEWERASLQNSISPSNCQYVPCGAITQCADDTRTMSFIPPESGSFSQDQNAIRERLSFLAGIHDLSLLSSVSLGRKSVAKIPSHVHAVVPEVFPNVGSIVSGESPISHPIHRTNDTDNVSRFSSDQRHSKVAKSTVSVNCETGGAPLLPEAEASSYFDPSMEDTRHGMDKVGALSTLSTATGAFAAPGKEGEGQIMTGKRKTKPTTLAAATVARGTTKTENVRGRLVQALAVARHPVPQERRKQFNVDSALLPSSGMQGVGVAVPLGYSDERFKAAKRNLVSLASSGNAIRRRTGGPESRGTLTRGKGFAKRNKACEREGSGAEGRNFPTGLVVSKNFRETKSGRDIFILEVSLRQLPPDDSDRGPSRTTTWGLEDEDFDANISAAYSAKQVVLSPRSRSLKETFESLAAGSEVLSLNTLMKWDYVSRSVERGLIPLNQVSFFFRQAHGERHRGKMVWQDMIPFYKYMESGLDNACAPPLIKELSIDSENWSSIFASVFLTKCGNVYLVAIDGVDDQGRRAPPPSPQTVRSGGHDRDKNIQFGDGITRFAVAAWATASVSSPDVPVQLTLYGLLPEHDYELFAYAEKEGGRLGGARWSSGEDATTLFSVEPARSGMSADSVAATRVAARTAPEPVEELDIPWEVLSEPEKMAEALAVLSDTTVARVVREVALDAPTAEDLEKVETDQVSRNKWKCFCRWWTSGAGGEERGDFLLRECVFAAQRSEVLEEAARMGVQILEGDWNAASEPTIASSTPAADDASARQYRWKTFRSWYRGGRVFDETLEALVIKPITENKLASPGSLAHILQRNAPSLEPLQPTAAPEEEEVELLQKKNLRISVMDERTIYTISDKSEISWSEAPETMLESRLEGIRRVTNPPELRPSPTPAIHIVNVEGGKYSKISWLDRVAPDLINRSVKGDRSTCSEGISVITANTVVSAARGHADAVHLSKSSGFDTEKQRGEAMHSSLDDEKSFGVITKGLPELPYGRQITAAKMYRLEARRRFLAVRTLASKEAAFKVKHLLDVKREDVKAKQTDDTSTVKMTHRRSQIEFELALKKAEEILDRSEKAADILKRRGSLGSLRPEDVASIGVFDHFNVKEFDPGEPDPDILCHGSISAGEGLCKNPHTGGVFDHFNVEEFDPEEPDPDIICHGSISAGEGLCKSPHTGGIFDHFNVEEFDPEEPDPNISCHGSISAGEGLRKSPHTGAQRKKLSGDRDSGPFRHVYSMDSTTIEATAWAIRSPDELTLELQLACVHPRVCVLAASAGIGVPDPEDSSSILNHRVDRWAKFSAWYYSREDGESITPQREALLRDEVLAATADEIVNARMQDEKILDDDSFDVSHFLHWYCEGGALSRQDFRRRRVEELLQSRRLIATEVLGYLPSPFLFREIPQLLPPPLPPSVERFQLYPSRSPEAFSWAEVSRWYREEDLNGEDDALRAEEHAGQTAAFLLDAAQAEESNNREVLERRVARWEDFRSSLMREAEAELEGDPFGVGEGGWQYHAALSSWTELEFPGFEAGSGLENKDELLDALEVARKEVREEKERVAEVRRQREIVRQKRLEEERRRREEKERLRWMRNTEQERLMIQQRMTNLKRQRALEAERKRMAREEALALVLMQEEKRLLQERLAKENALYKDLCSQEHAVAAAAAEVAAAQRRRESEASEMFREDGLSRQIEAEERAAETALRERDAYLRDLYTPYAPLWQRMWNTLSSEVEQGSEGCKGDDDEMRSRPTGWWQGAGAPQIWRGPLIAHSNVSKPRPGPRFVPHAQTILDGLDLDTQAFIVGRLSREFLGVLGLPRESVRDMYEEGRQTARDTGALVDSIQLGRIFTMFEDGQVCENLVSVEPLQQLEMRSPSRSSKVHPRFGTHNHQNVVPGETFSRRSNRECLPSRGVPLLSTLYGPRSRETQRRARSAGSHRLGKCGGGCTIPEQGPRRHGNAEFPGKCVAVLWPISRDTPYKKSTDKINGSSVDDGRVGLMPKISQQRKSAPVLMPVLDIKSLRKDTDGYDAIIQCSSSVCKQERGDW